MGEMINMTSEPGKDTRQTGNPLLAVAQKMAEDMQGKPGHMDFGRCKKCGGVAGKAMWLQVTDQEDFVRVWCSRCNYKWDVEPLDAKGGRDGQGI
jgi:hypothetical protein